MFNLIDEQINAGSRRVSPSLSVIIITIPHPKLLYWHWFPQIENSANSVALFESESYESLFMDFDGYTQR